ncbi:uncharacterized protein LOC142777165 [Rhipicephalus microplus]|uniref:uncharacterized protein LOC142777165 n=1 Tax=Rhipicephalus microplus TaxID=6941 RepID=UPI003F6B00F7
MMHCFTLPLPEATTPRRKRVLSEKSGVYKRCLKKSASPPSHARRLPLDTDSLGLISRFSSQEIPVVLVGLEEILSEPLHVAEARYQQMIQRSEEMRKTALQIIADFWNRDKSQEDSEC